MIFQLAAFSLSRCDSFSDQVPGAIMSFILLYLGGWLLVISRADKIKTMFIAWHYVRGKAAKFWSTVIATFLILLGSVALLSTIFGWGC